MEFEWRIRCKELIEMIRRAYSEEEFITIYEDSEARTIRICFSELDEAEFNEEINRCIKNSEKLIS